MHIKMHINVHYLCFLQYFIFANVFSAGTKLTRATAGRRAGLAPL